MKSSLFASLIILLICAQASAQRTLMNLEGQAPGDNFGFSVAAAGDVDADGVCDLIVGAPTVIGYGQVISGSDGRVLYTLTESSVFDFGTSVSRAGDCNLDGHADFMISGPRCITPSGMVQVISGIDGTTLTQFVGSGLDRFGSAIAEAGDVNGDGRVDLIVGAPNDDTNGTGAGRVYVFSGANFVILHDIQGAQSFDAFGTSVAGVGDVDRDGIDDFIVGAPNADDGGFNAGSAVVFSGLTGSVLRTYLGEAPFDGLGTSVAGLSVGRGQRPFIVVGAPQLALGYARVYRAGQIIHHLTGHNGNDRFGTSVCDALDVDGDGKSDFIIGAPRSASHGIEGGLAFLYSGANGTLLYEFQGTARSALGHSLAGVGDLNGDGFGEVIIGAPTTNDGIGRVTVHGGNDLFLNAHPATVSPGQALELRTRQGEPGALAALLLTQVDSFVLTRVILVSALDANGRFDLPGSVPNPLPNMDLRFKVLVLDSVNGIIETDTETLSIRNSG